MFYVVFNLWFHSTSRNYLNVHIAVEIYKYFEFQIQNSVGISKHLVSGRQTRSLRQNNPEPPLQNREGKTNWSCKDQERGRDFHRSIQFQNIPRSRGRVQLVLPRLPGHVWIRQGQVLVCVQPGFLNFLISCFTCCLTCGLLLAFLYNFLNQLKVKQVC